jgi:hypothetical protein
MILAQPSAEPEAEIVSQRGVVHVAPTYQQWSLDRFTFSEASSVLTWYHPLSKSASLSVRGAYGVAMSGDTLLRGPTDVQLTGTYYVEDADLVLSLGVGIPSGTKNLKFDQFLLSVRLANNVFQSNVPQFGTGLRLSPSIIWAIPASEELVFGLGAMFQYRGTFSPLANLGDYDPGDEVSFTGGMDLKLDETGSIAGDVVFSLYGKDKLDGREVFASGNKLLASLLFQKFFEMDALSVLLTFRTRAKAEIALANVQQPSSARIEPNQAEVVGAYTVHFSRRVSVQFSLEGRFFQETSAPLTGFDMFGISLAPEFKLSETVSLHLSVKYVYGK